MCSSLTGQQSGIRKTLYYKFIVNAKQKTILPDTSYLPFSFFFPFSFLFFSLSLLLRRECCSFSNGEYLKAGLLELEHWCLKATHEVNSSALAKPHVDKWKQFIRVHIHTTYIMTIHL